MSDIVVNKVINFLGKDQLTPTAQRVKQAMDNIKDKNVKLDVTADEQKIVTFSQKLQGLPKDVQTKLNAMAEKNGFDTFDSYMKALPKDQYTKLKANVENGGFEVFKSDLGKLPKSQQAQLKAIAKQEGFKNFDDMFKKVPKEARTKLDAVANTHAVEDFIHVTKDIPNHINTKVTADTSSANTSLERFSDRMDAAKEKTSRFKSIIGGSLIGGAVLNGLQAMSGGLISAAKSGIQVVEAGEQINRVWEGMGLNAGQTKAMVGSMAELRSATGFSAGAINDLQKKIYGFSGSFTTTQNLTRAFSALAIESGKGEDAANGLASSYAKVESSGKLSTMAYTRMSKAVPALPRELAKALNMTQDQLTKAISNGDITSQKFEDAMTQVAAHSSDTFDKFGKTGEGAIARIKSGWISAQGTLMKPLVDEKTTGLSDIADELNSKAFQGLLTDAGKGLAKLSQHVAVIIKYLSQNRGTISDITKDLGTIVGIFVKGVWDTTVTMFNDLGKAFGLIGKNSKDDADPLKTLAKLLDGVAKHKTAIKTLATAFVGFKAFKMSESAFEPLLRVAGLADRTKGGLLTKIIGDGDNQKKVFRFGVTGINDSKTKIKAFIGTVKDLALSGKNLAVAFGVKTIGALKTFGTTMMTLGKTALMNPYVDIALAVVALGVAFYEAYKHIKPFRDAMNKLGGNIVKGVKTGIDGAKKLFTGKLGWEQAIGKETGKIGKNIQSGFNTATDWVKKHKTEITASLVNPFAGATAWFLKDTKTGKNVTKWMTGLEASVKTSTKGKKGLGNNLTGIFKGVGDWLLKDKSTKKGFDKWMTGLESSVKNSTKGKKGLLANITGTFEGVSKWFKKDKGTKKAMKKWSDELGNVFSGKKGFAKKFSNSLDDMSKSLKKSKFGKSWDSFWKDTQKTTTSWDKNISKWWSGFSKDFGKKWDKSWKDRKTDMHDNWKNMHSAYDDFTTGIGKWWSGFSTSFGKDWNQGWKDRKTDMHDRWKGMHTAYDDFTTGINTWWSGFKSSFKSGWESFWKGVQKLFKDIFGTFKDLAHDAMKGVVGAINGGIGGINTVIHFFGGKAQSIAPIKYASGVGYHPGGPALINDQKGSVFEEAFKNPGEPWRIIPKMRNVMVDLKPGATVVPAAETARRFAPSSVPHYANGVGGWIKGELSDMGKWVKDKLEGITSFLKDPLGNLTSVWDKATSKITQSTKFGNVFAPPAGHYVVKQSIDWFKNVLGKLKDKELEAQSVAGEPKAAQAWLPIVKKILEQMGANPPKGIDWEAAAFVREIARESGGNPAIRQTVSDKNSLAGNPAMGLLQFIPQTFMAYAVPGHTNILSGEDQIMATANAYMHSGAWDRIGTGEQINFLANGGWTNGLSIAGEVPGQPEMVINPARPSAIPLMSNLMAKMADYHPELRASNLTSNISADLGQKLDIVINLLGSIEGKNFAPEINIARTSSNLNQQNRRNTDIYAYQRGDRQ
ncbi:tape measure protein [Companilactobacillus jidongensis]|uniref:tape measure protein n=1 Tax=Companilactobacillus jidongensis TaxID=2486006 RepID=UPI000F79E000|nr:tape measure protein [Companilactobacillus jidongensis]